MLNFSSVLYLGFRHESRSLKPWVQFTKGVPAALESPPGAIEVARKLAALQGHEEAVLAPSTLHLFWDLFDIVNRDSIMICVDESVYPIIQWGVEHGTARGIPLMKFRHHDVETLQQQLEQNALRGKHPVVVTDGFCTKCGRPAPIHSYMEILRPSGGYLFMDDTQALGILGHSPNPNAPYGLGGGGLLRWSNTQGYNVITISSLAKAFGVPIAVFASDRDITELFRLRSRTRVYCSPPSIPAINAAKHALDINHTHGDTLRSHLAKLVSRFRSKLARIGLLSRGGLFPVQTLEFEKAVCATQIHELLLQWGIRTVLSQGRLSKEIRISFLITALHRESDIDYAVDKLTQAIEICRERKHLALQEGGIGIKDTGRI